MSNGIVKRWHSRKPGWLENSAIRLDRIAIPDGFGADLTTYPQIVDFMERIGEAIASNIPKKAPGRNTKLIGITFQLPTNTPEDCFQLCCSPDKEGIDHQRIWDSFVSLTRPPVWEYTTCMMLFGVWE